MSNISSRLRSMQSQFAGPQKNDQEGGGSRRYYGLGKVELDQAVTLRFLPDKNKDNPMGFLKEIVNHNLRINGQEKRVACLEMYGETCPICEQAKQFYAQNQSTLGSQFWKKKNYVAQAIVIDDPLREDVDPNNPIRLFSLGKQIMSIIKEAVISGEVENDPDAYKGGYNFIIKKTKGGARADGSGFYPTYNIGTRFTSKPSDIPQELVDVIEANLMDLDKLLPQKPDITAVHADLQAALVGAGVGGSSPAPRSQAPARNVAPAAQDDDDVPFEGGQSTKSDAPALTTSTSQLLARLKRS